MWSHLKQEDLVPRIRRKPSRVKYFLVAGGFFTLGMVAAMTLFAYSSRIPVPLKEPPTRNGSGGVQIEPPITDSVTIKYPEALKRREISSGKLPQRESVVAPPTSAPPLAQKLAYYVRAGTFRRVEGADSRAAELTAGLATFGARVEVRQDSGGTAGQLLYWVLIGPFEASGYADEIRAHLALLGMDTRMERLPVGGATQ